MEIKKISNLSEITKSNAFILDTSNTVYDLQGLVIPGDITITASSVTLKNATVTGQVYVNASCCKFKNVKFVSISQAVIFGTDTSNSHFKECTFDGQGVGETTYAVEMSADNANIIFSNCRFKNYHTVIKATREVSCIFNNCRCSDVSKVIYSNGDWVTGTDNTLKANVVINNMDFDAIDYVCVIKQSDSILSKIKAEANIVVGGTFGEIKSAVVDFEDGFVNLECNVTGTYDIKLFTDDSPKTRYCNVKKPGDNSYRVGATSTPYTFTMTLLPNEMSIPFGALNFTGIDWWIEEDGAFVADSTDSPALSVKVDGEEVTSKTAFHSGSLSLKNNKTDDLTIKFTVTTNCILL